MNTTEINGSAWSIRYYVAASVPLTMSTLLLPLFALQTFNYLVLTYQTSVPFRRAIKWGWISVAFILELLSQVLPIIDAASYVLRLVSFIIVGIAALIFQIRFAIAHKFQLKHSIALRSNLHNGGITPKELRRTLCSNYRLWSLFFGVTLMLQSFISNFPESGFRYVALAPFILCFCIQGYRKIYCTYIRA